MAIPVFNESTMRYHDPATGRMVKSPEKSESQAPSSNLGASSIVSALRTEFKGLNAHLAFRFDSVIEAMRGTPAERRDELISSENTDAPPPIDPPTDTDSKSFMDTLRGLNPFQDGIGTKTTILLLTGALFAITQFGDKLIKPLASFLEWADGDPTESIGEYSEKFKKWWATKWAGVKLFWADIKVKFEDMKKEYENLKEWWEPKWASVKSFLKLFKDMFTGLDEWMKSYDEDDDGILNPDEMKKMMDDALTKIKENVMGLVHEVVIGIVSAIGLLTIGKLALATVLSPTVGAPLAAGAAARAGVGLGTGLLGTAALTGLVVAGLWLLTDKVADAYHDAIRDEAGNVKNFDGKEFLARFFGGDDEGGWINAVTTGLKSAIIGGAAGMTYGSIVPGVGTAIGGAVGAIIGGVIGVTGGALGKNKIKSWLDEFALNYDKAINSLKNSFDDIILRAKAAITPGVSVDDVSNALANERSNEKRNDINEQIEINQRKIDKYKSQYFVEKDGSYSKRTRESLIPLVAGLERQNAILQGNLLLIPQGPAMIGPQKPLSVIEAETSSFLERLNNSISRNLSPMQGAFQSDINDKKILKNVFEEVPTQKDSTNYYDIKTPISTQNFTTAVTNKMDADNSAPSARLLGPAFVPGGSPLLNF